MMRKVLKKIERFYFGFLGLYFKFSRSNVPKKVILMVDGGLGSQINKYLIGRFLENKRNVRVEYDLSWFNENGRSLDGKNTRNFDLLSVFPDLALPIADKQEAKSFKKYFCYLNSKPFKFNNKIIHKKLPLYVDGYYFHFKYILDGNVFKEFEFNKNLFDLNRDYLNQISKSNSVSVHVRRGDYVNSSHDVLVAAYWVNAISYLAEKLGNASPIFFIFSNGMDWVKKEILTRLPERISVILVEGNGESSGASDFFLMSNCNHHICSNSSFSFYAASLGRHKEKYVIIPEFWMKSSSISEDVNKAFRYPGWIVMSNNGLVVP